MCLWRRRRRQLGQTLRAHLRIRHRVHAAREEDVPIGVPHLLLGSSWMLGVSSEFARIGGPFHLGKNGKGSKGEKKGAYLSTQVSYELSNGRGVACQLEVRPPTSAVEDMPKICQQPRSNCINNSVKEKGVTYTDAERKKDTFRFTDTRGTPVAVMPAAVVILYASSPSSLSVREGQVHYEMEGKEGNGVAYTSNM